VISPHQSRTDEQLEVMHKEIVPKPADIGSDRIRSLDIESVCCLLVLESSLFFGLNTT
jgi:hypothetical protein